MNENREVTGIIFYYVLHLCHPSYIKMPRKLDSNICTKKMFMVGSLFNDAFLVTRLYSGDGRAVSE
jgi:hypothetical protein